MSTPETSLNVRLDGTPDIRGVVDAWSESLVQVLESMTDHKPEVHWKPASGSPAEARGVSSGAEAADAELLWWEQPFHIAPGTAAWLAAPRGVWEHCGTLTLKAAGLESVESGEARNTWLEIVGQTMGGMARSLTALLGREVTCEPGSEHAPEIPLQEWAAVTVAFPEGPLPVFLLGFSGALASLAANPPVSEPEAAAHDVPRQPKAGPEEPERPHSRTMDLLLDVDLPISISFGRTQLPMKDVLKLTTGSIVELNRNVNDPVEVLVNHCLIARGEVVVVEGNYGVRIQEIASRQDRLRSIR
jgi:flagellar motor switch protein FliN